MLGTEPFSATPNMWVEKNNDMIHDLLLHNSSKNLRQGKHHLFWKL